MSAVYFYLKQEFAIAGKAEPLFAWDQWKSTDYYFLPDSKEIDNLSSISGNANRALCIAVGECLCALLQGASRRDEALEYFDAAWVCQIDLRRCEFVELDATEWAGPTDGALRAAIMIVNDVIFEAPHDFQFSLRSCWALNLLRHVAGPLASELWQDWISPVIGALQKHHADFGFESQSIFDRAFTFGLPVGVSLFTLDPNYSPEAAEEELRTHFSRLRDDNPYRGDRP